MRINFGRKVHLDFTPRVFLCRTHSYILVRRGTKWGYFLTMEPGSIELVKLHLTDDGGYLFTKRNEGEGSKEQTWLEYPLSPYPKCSLEKALKLYRDSCLAKSVKAQRALTELSGMGTPEPEPEKPRATPVRSPEGAFTLQDLCDELKMDSGKARARLRAQGIFKPGARWEWASRGQAKKVEQALRSSK